MLKAYLYEGLRTPFGRHGGTLAKVRPDDLLADAIKNLMKKSAFKPEQIEDIIVGCANQGGEDSRCVARHAGLVAGLPIETPGTVLQRNCASGLGAVVHAAHAISAGEGDVYLVGGVESMSRSPLVMSRAESAFARDIKLYDGPGVSKARNVQTGFDRAEGDILMILDADLTTMPEELSYFYDTLACGRAEFVNGSRFIFPM
jgi:acetyl-CoA C-acetyltransferase